MLNSFQLGDTYLKDVQVRELLIGKGINNNFDRKDLRVLNLQGANLTDTSFRETNLSETNLQNSNLSRAKLINTNLDGACFTGACIEDWNINSQTKLDNVVADYIYLKQGQQERRPSDPNRKFEPGEFAKLVQKSIETLDLIFKNGIDWKAFLSSYQDIQVEYGEQNVSIQTIEKKSDGAFVIRLSVPPDADKANMETSFWQIYNPILQAKDEQLALYGQVLNDQRKENTRLIGIIETMAERDDTFLNQHQINILKTINSGIFKSTDIANALGLEKHLVKYYLDEFDKLDFIRGSRGFENGWREYRICQLSHKGQVALQDQNLLVKESSMSNTVNNNLQGANIGNFANEVKDNARQQANQNIYASEQKQTLAEAAKEIQKLLQQLESSNPTATEAQQIEHINDETTPKFKRKAFAALKAAGDTAIDEFLDNSYVKVCKAAIMGWIDS
ncbi:MAG: pentapeptide repeat-containing protein [Xenococcus sp. MO_188.B8]|nr:pentapeptide repeat-containing protein [Xenococcus sp. MO_188.B8]